MKLFKYLSFALLLLSQFTFAAIDLVEEDEELVTPKVEAPKAETKKGTTPASTQTPITSPEASVAPSKTTEAQPVTQSATNPKIAENKNDSAANADVSNKLDSAQMETTLKETEPSLNADSTVSAQPDSTQTQDSMLVAALVNNDTKALASSEVNQEIQSLKDQLAKQAKDIQALQTQKEEEEDNKDWKKRFLWQTPLVIGLFVLGFLMGGGNF